MKRYRYLDQDQASLLFFSTSARTEIKFLSSQVSACRSHFPALISKAPQLEQKWIQSQTGQWHDVPACQRIMCVDTSHKGRLTTDLCPRTKVSRLPFPTPCVIPGLQNKTETNKSNFRLDLSCLGLSTHTKSLSSSIWIQHCVLARNYKNSLTL